MGRSRGKEPAPVVTAARAARLAKMVALTADAPRTRKALLARLKVDLRGFYRDLELLRTLGVAVALDADKYRLAGPLDDALAHLPFPDPGLSVRDAVHLSAGRTEAHKKLRARVQAFLGTPGPQPTGG